MGEDIEALRDIAAPVIARADAIRIRRFDVGRKVGTQQIPAVVWAPETLELAVGQRHRSQFVEEGLPKGAGV